VRRFEQEARAAGQLNHPNILAVHDTGLHAGVPYIVSELLEGEKLRSRLTTGPMSPRKAIDTAGQIAEGLAAAHDRGIVHRDVKPDNLFLTTDGRVKILDFGIAKLAAVPLPPPDTGQITLVQVDTEPGTILGTVRYMSPEQVRGQEVDTRADVFALGAVLYEMNAGCPAFTGATAGDLIVAILEREPQPLAEVRPDAPAGLDAVVRRALSKRRETRYASADEMASDLAEIRLRLEAEVTLERLGRSGRTTAMRTTARSSVTRRTKTRKPVDSLAVLPLENAGDDPDTEYLSDGITESIINGLAQLPRLRVVSRTTVFRFKGHRIDPLDAGRELGVRAVLAGRVVRVADALVVKIELVDVANDAQLWGQQYQRKRTDIFSLQEEIAREICAQLRLHLSGDERKRLAKRATENAEAYDVYLRGRYCINKRTQEWLRKGIGFFQQAIDLDSNFALAYTGLADAYGLLASSTGGLPPVDTYPKAKAAATKALELDDTLCEAHTSLGFFRLLYDWDSTAAESSFRRALELNPNYSTAHDGYGFFCKATGRFDEAIASCTRALELDPLSLFLTCSVAWAHYFARDFASATVYARKALEMDPDLASAYWILGLALEPLGRLREAIESFQAAAARSGRGPTFLGHLGRAYALAGRGVEAQMVLDDLARQSDGRYVSSYSFALVHLGLGETDAAFAWLERAYEERSGFLAFLGVEPMLDSVRGDERFVDLARRVGVLQHLIDSGETRGPGRAAGT
jgi:TolB-like protein/Flp pilus assembly protein TadD